MISWFMGITLRFVSDVSKAFVAPFDGIRSLAMRVNYPQLFTDHHVATLHEWLLETRELYVHDELPHSGGDGRSYLVRSLRDVKRLVSSITHNEVEIFICRNLQLPVRAACSMYARAITDGMALADADAFAAYATMRGLTEECIVPRMDDWELYPHVAAAVGVPAQEE